MKRLIVIMACALAPLMASAQITLEQCRDAAREHYPEMAQYKLIDLSEEYNVENAARNWIPQITLSGQATWQSDVTAFPEQFSSMLKAYGIDMPGLSKDQYKVALDVNQLIWDGGASKANRAVAKAEAQEQRLSSEVDIYSLNQRINDLYFGMLLLEENYSTAQSRRELLEKNLQKLQSMYKNGLVMQSDVDQIEVEILMLDQSIDQNRQSLSAYRTMLEAMTGLELENRTLEIPAELNVFASVNNRPELGAIDARIATMDAKKDALKVSLTPKFSVFAQGYYGYPGLDMYAGMMSRDWTWNAVAGVRMQWNISSLFTYAADKKKLDNARGMIALQKDIFEYNTNLQTIQENGDILRMKRALESDERIVELRSNIRSSAESQLSNGVIDTADLLKKITEETEAMNNRNIHEIELLKKEYELENTLN